MGLLSDQEIHKLVEEQNMINPFIDRVISPPDGLSYGLAVASYEVRVQPKWKLFDHQYSKVIDPINFDPAACIDSEAEEIIMPPNSFVLCYTIETFKLPNNISIICLTKSTYARCGIIVNATVIEPGISGTIVLELSNTSPCSVKIKAGNSGVAKFVFFEVKNPSGRVYSGNYNYQNGIVLPKNR